MHPAPSVIVFTVLSGAGFGLLGFLALGAVEVYGGAAFLLWGLGYGLTVIGLLASTFHLGNPSRALRAFTQWRTSWLSREAWASAGALLLLAPVALAAVMGGGLPGHFGALGAVACLVAVVSTAMIYAQLKTVPRWNHWTTPALFLAFAATSGAILSGQARIAALACLGLGVLLIVAFRIGDGRFRAAGQTLSTATGLGTGGSVRQFAPAHTGPNYLTREMIHVVGRRHSARLRIIAVVFAALVPLLGLIVLPPVLPFMAAVFAVHVVGAFVARWLFFAEAEHVVGLYYGQREGAPG